MKFSLVHFTVYRTIGRSHVAHIGPFAQSQTLSIPPQTITVISLTFAIDKSDDLVG